jgi:exopolysaccharide production protein ExoZ
MNDRENQPNWKFISSTYFTQIQILRGLAAFAVLFCHLPEEILIAINAPFKQLPGAFGVDVFFVISGFLMMYVTENGTKDFLVKRAVRILPLYWICTLIYGIYYDIGSMEQVMRSIFLLPDPIVGQAWTLIYEVIFYMIIFLSAKISIKHRGLITSAVLITIASAGVYLKPWLNETTGFYFSSIILEFIFGIGAYWFVKQSMIKIPKLLSLFICFISVGMMYILKIMIFRDSFIAGENLTGTNEWNLRFLCWGVFALVIFVSFFCGFRGYKFPKIFVFFGDISFSVYLIHTIVIDIVRQTGLFDFSRFVQWLFGTIVILIVTIAVSSLSYLLFEKKLLDWTKQKMRLISIASPK